MNNKQLKQKSIGANAIILTASKFVSTLILLVNTMLLSRFRTLAEYGTYSQLLVVVHLVTSFVTLGLPSSINYFVARADTDKERNRFISIYYTLNTVLSFVTGLILLLSIPLIEAYFKNTEIGRYYIFLALYPWTSIITSSVDNLLIVHGRSEKLLLYKVLHSICVVLCVLLVTLTKLDFIAYIYLYLFVEILFCLLTYAIAIKLDGRPTFKFNKKYIKTILAFSIPLGLSTATGTIKAEMDKLFIGFLYSTEQYAIYANAAKELPFTMISHSITAVLLPVIARKLKDNRIKESVDLWKEATSVAYMINSFFAFGLIVFSKEAMVFLYSQKYESGFAVFAIYSLLMLFRSAYFGTMLQLRGKTNIILKSSIFSLVLNLVLNFVFYYFIGFIGPAVATILATAISSGYQLVKTKEEISVPIKRLFPWRDILLCTFINIGLGLVFYLAKVILQMDTYIGRSAEAILLALVWLIIYMILLIPKIKQKTKLFRTNN